MLVASVFKSIAWGFPSWWGREMTIQIFFREFFTAVRKILTLYLQENTGSPDRSSLSQGIYYSCIKRKKFSYTNQKLTKPAPLRTLSEISQGTVDWLPFCWWIISFITGFSMWDLEIRTQGLLKRTGCNLSEKPLPALWLVRQLINIFWNGALVHIAKLQSVHLFFWGKEVEWWKLNCYFRLGKTI